MYQVTVREISSEIKKETVGRKKFDWPDNIPWNEQKDRNQYEYVEVETTRESSKEILSQTVEELNIAAVIKAINNI